MIRLMTALVPLMLAVGAATAQDHSQHAPPPRPPAQAPAADPHAGHAMPPATPLPDPHAGHNVRARPQSADPHAGHVRPAQADPHAGHAMVGDPPGAGTGPPHVPTSADDDGRPRRLPPPPTALSGPAHAADAIWGVDRMTGARDILRRENGDVRATAVIFDRLEVGFGEGKEGWTWDVAGWTGGDIDRFWWKSEGAGDFEGDAEGEVQALYSRAISPFWDVQTGVRQDLGEDGDDPTHLVLGLQGLAPHWWEVDAVAFLTTEGDLTARVEADYDQRITQRLIVQPRIEVEASGSDVPELGLGSGVTHIEAGVRLRYEIIPAFAPYVGVEWRRELGRTADLTRALGGEPEDTRFLIGIRAWY